VYCLCVNVCCTAATRIFGHFSTTLSEVFRAFPQLYGKCQGITGKDGARSALSAFFLFIFMYVPFCVFCVLLVCKCVLYCIVLYCTVLYCIVLYYTVLYCTVLLSPGVNQIAVNKHINKSAMAQIENKLQNI
jgi:hypothetical protein